MVHYIKYSHTFKYNHLLAKGWHWIRSLYPIIIFFQLVIEPKVWSWMRTWKAEAYLPIPIMWIHLKWFGSIVWAKFSNTCLWPVERLIRAISTFMGLITNESFQSRCLLCKRGWVKWECNSLPHSRGHFRGNIVKNFVCYAISERYPFTIARICLCTHFSLKEIT